LEEGLCWTQQGLSAGTAEIKERNKKNTKSSPQAEVSTPTGGAFFMYF